MIKKLFIGSIIAVFIFLIPVKTSAEVPQELYNLISNWNNTVEYLEQKWGQREDRNADIASNLYLTESDLSSENKMNNNRYIINLFKNNAGWEIELNIDYREAEDKIKIYVLNMQENRDIFIKTNFYAAHAGEVLIYAMANNDSQAQNLVKELGVYDFWGNNINEIAAYNQLDSKELESGKEHVSHIGEFNLYFDVYDDGGFPNTFDIGYSNL